MKQISIFFLIFILNFTNVYGADDLNFIKWKNQFKKKDL